MTNRYARRAEVSSRILLVALLVWQATFLSGCAVVSATTTSPSRYLAERRADVLTTGRLSNTAREALRIVGIENCREAPAACRDRLGEATGLTQEQRLSALSELWLEAALAADKEFGRWPTASARDPVLDAWIECARHAWAYLFFTERQPAQRAFEEQQMQVRDYYNYAVQRTVERLFLYHAKEAAASNGAPRMVSQWQLSIDAGPLVQKEQGAPQHLFAASALRFDGLRNTYRRGGLGATLVAELAPPVAQTKDVPFLQSRYPVGTAVLSFEGRSLSEVLTTHSIELRLYDPYRTAQVKLAGQEVPLAANFTAGYGLWLARSGFSTQALRSLFGMNEGIVRPRIHLMQPYDPDRGVVILLHGFASSPEAWVNVANEVMGDEVLRQNYQIWQVYYPTNAPVLLNLYMIREAILQTLSRFDPRGDALGSHDVVLVGHSLGGVLARLLVSDSGEAVWQALPDHLGDYRDKNEALRTGLGKYVEFSALPQVERAVFIAAPHRGTPFAVGALATIISDLIAFPKALQDQISGVRDALVQAEPFKEGEALPPVPNSIDTLSDKDPVVRVLAQLPIDARVRYHSIIARENTEGALAESMDGVVPYASSHLDGADSELIVVSRHSVQENPKAILEVRRILHLDLQARPTPSRQRSSAPR
ncbi:alpha/beta fold hydrolase [Variovorax dokdonensis]|uniref:Alpha/beta fold hydrolase n=1 Tax=Variovorax dokdonensis TaxID=344883 RepID=A0ABT7N928_9BURK|nr:alpha/beta fold hydrolase [Variovorax dokdonensis]MDM0044438.1 alpha/beta fold hydrolase [Variovorax dokdonensis]